jgi:hypothetical protein
VDTHPIETCPPDEAGESSFGEPTQVVGIGVHWVQKRHRKKKPPPRPEYAIGFCEHQFGQVNVLKNLSADDGIRTRIAKWDTGDISDDIWAD